MTDPFTEHQQAAREQILNNWMKKKLTKELKKKAEKLLKVEVKTYNQYLQGDVWAYIIKDEDGEHVDSCYGFYGEEECKEEGEAQLKWFQEKGE